MSRTFNGFEWSLYFRQYITTVVRARLCFSPMSTTGGIAIESVILVPSGLRAMGEMLEVTEENIKMFERLEFDNEPRLEYLFVGSTYKDVGGSQVKLIEVDVDAEYGNEIFANFHSIKESAEKRVHLSLVDFLDQYTVVKDAG